MMSTVEPAEIVPARATLDRERLDLLKRTIARDLDDNELALFAQVCNRTGLDPFMRQIHAVKRYSRRDDRHTMTIQVGIDGYRLIADRTGLYAGNEDPVYEGTLTVGEGRDARQVPALARVTVWKIVGGQRVPFTASARWSEYYPDQPMWLRMPHVMLGKVAEALALRKAFPAELSGLYTAEEMAQADHRAVSVGEPDAAPLHREHDDLRRRTHELEARFAALPEPARKEFVAWKRERRFTFIVGVGYEAAALDEMAARLDDLERAHAVGAGESGDREAAADDGAPAGDIRSEGSGVGDEPAGASPSSAPTRPDRAAVGDDGSSPTAAASPDLTAEELALATAPCSQCGSTRATRLVGAGGRVLCRNRADCDRRAAERAAREGTCRVPDCTESENLDETGYCRAHAQF